MKTLPAAIPLAVAMLAGVAGGLRASNLSMAVSPLVVPSESSVRQALGNLDAIAGKQSGNTKVRTQRVAAVVRNLFLAENRVREALAATDRANRAAKRLDSNAAGWMRPNAFGRTNPQAAAEAKRKAAALRARAARGVNAARDHLAAQGREMEVVMRNFQDLGDLPLVITLGKTLRTVLDRSLGGRDFQLVFPPAALARLETTVRCQSQWRALAADAENQGRHEVAFRYFTMAADFAAARRCAAAMAPELAEAGLHGSAIEAYETAGDKDSARALRAAHPAPGTVEFRKLPPDELQWRVSSSCVRILGKDSRPVGIGYFFRRGGFILTPREILPGNARQILVRLDDARTLKARILPSAESTGLAILRVPVEQHQFLLPARNSDIRKTTPAFLPAPAKPTASASASPAPVHIAATARTAPTGAPAFRIDRPARPGTPVVDDRARVLGIVLPRAGKHPSSSLLPADAIRSFTGGKTASVFTFE
jgi:S1-C subfamily serine protease